MPSQPVTRPAKSHGNPSTKRRPSRHYQRAPKWRNRPQGPGATVEKEAPPRHTGRAATSLEVLSEASVPPLVNQRQYTDPSTTGTATHIYQLPNLMISGPLWEKAFVVGRL